MHICFLTHEYPKSGHPHGGIGSFVKTLSNELVKKGVKVSVVGVNYGSSDEESSDCGVNVYRVSRTKIKGLTWWLNSQRINRKLKEIHQSDPIDIVEATELGLAFIHKIPSVKYVIRLHGGHHFFAEAEKRPINWWKGFQEKRSFEKADAFIAVSEFVRTHTEQYLSFNKKRVELIRYPIDLNFFEPQQVEPRPYQVVFAGTVCEKKGIRQLIQAFPTVRRRFPEATLEIFGRDWKYDDGTSYIASLKKDEIVAIGADASAITFHGAIDRGDLRTAYAGAGVCVFPSHMETQGLVAPEAMAMEKVVVFTETGPGPETIVPYWTGLLCDPYDPDDIAAKICWVFENRQESIKIGKDARQAVLSNFDLVKVTQLNIDFHNGLMTDRRL